MNNQYGTVQYTYFCKKCSKNFKYILTFEEWQQKDYACARCLNKLKYVTCNDIRETTGNINYKSAEKQSEENIRRIGHEAMDEMCRNDPAIALKYEQSRLKESELPWWRKTLKDPTKPLDLSTIKDTEKFIMTGDTE